MPSRQPVLSRLAGNREFLAGVNPMVCEKPAFSARLANVAFPFTLFGINGLDLQWLTFVRPLSPGLRTAEAPHLPITEVRHDIPLVRFSDSANHREWKRLVRDRRKLAKLITRTDAYRIGNTVLMTPAMADALRRESEFWSSVGRAS